MAKTTRKQWIGIILLADVLLMQLIPIDRKNPAINTGEDFLYSRMVPQDMQTLIKGACYDCHSNETEYPWYSRIAPVSFILRHHIDEGRDHVNFSIWNRYMDKRKDHTLDECIEVVERGEMPLKAFTWLHPEAKLSQDQRNQIITFFKEQVAALGWREMGSEEEEEMERDKD